MRRVGIIAQEGEKRSAYRILVGNPVGKRPQEDLAVGRKIMLNRS
jgi:hypothetical protein